MARDFQINQPIAVPKALTTAVLVKFDATVTPPVIEAKLDPDGSMSAFDLNEIEPFVWKASLDSVSGFIYKAKAWRDWKGNRMLSVQAHRLRDNGSYAGRRRILLKKNGKICKI